MVHLDRCACLLVLCATAVVAMPSIGGIQNNYSYLLEGTPNYGIARGGIFILYGAGMAGPGLIQGGFNPTLDPALGGVSIRVTVNGVTTTAIPYYVSAGQIAAILPSATPVGVGGITVTFGGQTSAPYPIQVVENAFGLMTMSGNGFGQAVIMNADFGLLSPSNSALEDQVVIFWGSGLGPSSGAETELIAAPQAIGAPFELYIGNKLAETLYHGQSQYPGLHQIVARIPRGALGCFVSVYVKTGAYISNFNTIPVASQPGGCSEPFAAGTELQMLAGQNDVTGGWLYLGRFTHHARALGGGLTTLITDSATAQFLRYTPFEYLNYGGASQPSFGSCIVSNYVLTNPFTPPIQEFLNPGPVTLTLPNGTVKPLIKNPVSDTLAGSDTNPATPLFIGNPGDRYTFTGAGSAQVGAFSVSTTLPSKFQSENLAGITNIGRDANLELAWSGGEPDSYVAVVGVSSDLTSIFTTFSCTERTSVGRITIPRDVLASMIPSKVIQETPFLATTGQILIYNYTLPTKFSADKIDNGNIAFFASETGVVVYK